MLDCIPKVYIANPWQLHGKQAAESLLAAKKERLHAGTRLSCYWADKNLLATRGFHKRQVKLHIALFESTDLLGMKVWSSQGCSIWGIQISIIPKPGNLQLDAATTCLCNKRLHSRRRLRCRIQSPRPTQADLHCSLVCHSVRLQPTM